MNHSKRYELFTKFKNKQKHCIISNVDSEQAKDFEEEKKNN